MNQALQISEVTAEAGHERTNRQWVRYWLYGIALLVFAMIMVGGATRLTDSGLSITEWKPIHGVIPPLSHAEWMEEFDKYRQIPEYQQINKGMSLAEFQFIYWWEWAHRFLGRLVGFVFVVPLVFFWMTKRLENRLKPRLIGLLALGGLQGFVGWWMVSSGLSERVDVSQYRLATHLVLACIIYAWAIWIARGLAQHSAGAVPLRLKLFAPAIALAVLLQIFLGALVAGLDAGLAFNDWPAMDGQAVPGDLFVLQPWWLNFFENPKTVQFVHRIGGYAVLALALVQWLAVRASGAAQPHKNRSVVLLALVTGQAVIGILTLVLQVPLGWALAHQAGAAIVLAFAVAHWRAVHGAWPQHTEVMLRS